MKLFHAVCIFIALFTSGCAYQPVIDQRGVDPTQYAADLADCRHYAESVSPGGEAAATAVAGGVIGAALGAIVGDSQTAGQGAAIGALLGGTEGGANGADKQQQIIARCLAGRGYKVLQ